MSQIQNLNPATGTGFISTINNVGPNGSGNFTLESTDGSITFSNVANGQNLSVNYYSLTPFIVGSDTHSQYTTIGAGIAAAVSAGASSSSPRNVYIKPGVYTENLTLADGVNLIGFSSSTTSYTSLGSSTIVGKCSLSTTASVVISGLVLQTNSDYAVSVTGSAAGAGSLVLLKDCCISLTNNTGLNCSSTNGTITLLNCTNNDTGSNAFFASSNAGNIVIRHCNIFGTGTSSACTLTGSAALQIYRSGFYYPISSSSTSTVGILNSDLQMQGNFTALTIGGTAGNNIVEHCRIGSGSASAISISASSQCLVTHCAVDCTNTNTITGSGTLLYAFISFTNTSSGVNTTTQTALATLI